MSRMISLRVVVFANCQGEFLLNNWLGRIFERYDYIANYKDEFTDGDLAAIRNCDIFIAQPANGLTVGDARILDLLKPDCRKVMFPSIYADIFPIYEEAGRYVGGQVIDKYRHLPLEQILAIYDDGGFEFESRDRFERSMEHMAGREIYCTIKVSDYLRQNYRTHRLFTTQNHINGVLGEFLVQEICLQLNVEAPDLYGRSSESIITPGPVWLDSLYMRKELGLEFVTSDLGALYYRELIAFLYHNPACVKYKYGAV